jgi:hypothetical protein
MDPVTIGIGAAAALGQGANIIATNRLNKKTREWNEKMYGIQRKDALSDWDRQNAYNAPQQQMQRLKEAGLNPNMVYGKGTIDNQTGAVRSTDVKGWQPDVPKIDAQAIPQMLSAFVDMEQKKVSTDNTRAATKVAEEQAKYISANRLKVLGETDYTLFKKLKDQTLLDYQVDAAAEGLRKTRAETSNILGSNERAWQIHNATLQPTINLKLAEIASINAKTANTKFERAILEANAEKMRTETNILKLTGPQQVQLNNYLANEKRLNNMFNENTQEARKEAIQLENFLKKMQVPTDIKKDVLKVLVPWY